MFYLGINSSQFDGDDFAGYKKPGIISGAGVNYPLSEHWSCQGEIFYSRKGSKEISETIYFLLQLNYLEMPFLFIYHAGVFDLQAGAGYGVLISSRLNIGYGFTEIDDIKSYDVPFIAGFNYHFTEHIGFDFRFNYSMLNVLKEGHVGRGGFLKGYNNLLSSSIRYFF